jgi:hypothetical protein
MSLHINRFVDSIKAHESRGQRDFVMTIREAKDLHNDITKLLLTLETLHTQNTPSKQESITVELSGGSFKTA